MAQQLQFDRQCSLIVYNPPTYSQGSTVSPATGSATTSSTGAAPGQGLDLSDMRIQFRTSQSDIETPNSALIRVYNLKDETVRKVQGEFQRVVLQAGYKNAAYGVIFDGTIKAVLRGNETNVDSYIDIFAADGDVAYNHGVVSASLAAGSKPQDQVDAVAKAMGVAVGYMDLPFAALGRGKVMFGLGRTAMRRIAETGGATWSIQNGQITVIPLTGYKPGEAVVLNSSTGLIGFPQQTPGGIRVTALLNPKIQISTLLQIDNKAINQGFPATPGQFLYGAGRLDHLSGFNAKISDDGFYKTIVHECVGDTRGQDWYSEIICLAVDPSAPSGQQVAPYWAGGPRS